MNSKENAILFYLNEDFKDITYLISKITNIHVGETKMVNFADGEFLFTTNDIVRGKNVFVVHSTCNPVNENVMKLLIAVDAIKRASAKSISLIIPYYGYSRQDRKTNGREPITSRLVADLIETAGANRVLTIDIHSKQQQGFFSIPFDSITATWLLIDAFNKENPSLLKNAVVVSPDYGGVKRARSIATKINVEFAIIDKDRIGTNQVKSNFIIGTNVKDKNCFIIDDIIDTGGTITNSIDILKKAGAKTINVLATHGIFSKNALSNFDKLFQDNKLNNLYITNSIYHSNLPKFINVIDISNILADAINVFSNNNGSLSLIYHKYKYYSDF